MNDILTRINKENYKAHLRRQAVFDYGHAFDGCYMCKKTQAFYKAIAKANLDYFEKHEVQE